MNEANQQWQRLSPVAIVYYLFKIIKEIVANAMQGLAPLAVVIFTADNKAFMIATVASVGLVLLISTALLQYWYFRYCMVGDEIRINQGVFKKQHRVISFDRVQNININQPFYFKPFNLVSLLVETAGSSSGEGTLAGIDQTRAEQIRDEVLTRQHNSNSDSSLSEAAETQSNPDEDGQTLVKASTRDIVNYGLANNTAFVLLAVVMPFYKIIEKQVSAYFEDGRLDWWFALFPGKVMAIVLLAALVTLTIILVFTLLSVIGALLRYHGYRLSLNGGTLKRKSGLINSHEEALNLSKIQAFKRHSNFIARWLKIENLILQQTGSGGANPNQAQQAQGNMFVIPARTPLQSQALIEKIIDDAESIEQTFAISKRYIVKTFFANWMLPVLLVCVPFIIAGIEAFWLGLLIPFMVLPLIYLRWRKYRYGLGQSHGLIETGLIGYKYEQFPLFKVQRVEISQSLWQKPVGMANLSIVMASSTLTIPYMTIDHAKAWFDNIYLHIETDQRPWF